MGSRSQFVGRAQELETVVELVTATPLVTLTGPGGVGKTRLAVEACTRLGGAFAGDPTLVELSDLTPGADVDTISAELAVGSPEGLALRLGERRSLVVLDNCEHVLDAAATFVGRLLAATESVTVLTTSRQPLGLDGERVIVVEPLALPGPGELEPLTSPAVELFLARATAAGASWGRSAETVELVAELCRHVDGLPLAIELAASRARSVSPSELLALLARRLDVLRSQRRDVPARHHSVRAAIEFSVGLLDEDSHRLLLRLGAFAGQFDLALVHTAAGPELEDRLRTVDLLGGLVERSLVVAEPSATTTRYRLLELVREYAAEELRGAGLWIETKERLTEALVAEADAILVEGTTRWSGELVARISNRFGNFFAAIDWCVSHDDGPARAIRLFLPLFAAVHQSRSGEVIVAGERIFARWPDAPAPLRAEALAVLATAHAIALQVDQARERAQAALEDPMGTGIATVLAHRALVLLSIATGDTDEGLVLAARGREAASDAGMAPFERELRGFEATLLDRAGRSDDAATLARRVVADSVAADDPLTEVWARLVSATIAVRAGRWDDARVEIASGQETSRRLSTGWWSGAIFRSQAVLAATEAAVGAMEAGWDASRAIWRQAVQQAADRGDVAELGLTLRAAATVAEQSGRFETARALRSAAPGTNVLTVLPDLFGADRPPATSAAATLGATSPLGVVAALRAALDAIDADSADSGHPPDRPSSTGATPATDRSPQLGGEASLEREGDVWAFAFAGTTVRIRSLKGVADIAALLVRPDEDVHCLELMGAAHVGDSPGPTIDDRARRAYQARIGDLQAEIDEAKSANDPARADRAERELDAIVAELSEAFGLRGRARTGGSSAERARSAVTYRIRAAIRHITAQHAELGRHLDRSIRTGTWCSYRPEHRVHWQTERSSPVRA